MGGRDGVHVGSQVAARQERCCCLPHLLRAPGVGDNALTGLLNIQTHLEPTSQSQRQHHQPHRRWLPSRCPTAESKPQTPRASEELWVQTPFIAMSTLRRREGVTPGLGEKLVGNATGYRVRRWEGVCQKEQLPRPYPTSAAGRSADQVSNLGNREKRPGRSAKSPQLAGGPCQFSRWPPTRNSRPKGSGLKGHWHLTPTPTEGTGGKQEETGCFVKGFPVLGDTSFLPHPEGAQGNRHSLASTCL